MPHSEFDVPILIDRSGKMKVSGPVKLAPSEAPKPDGSPPDAVVVWVVRQGDRVAAGMTNTTGERWSAVESEPSAFWAIGNSDAEAVATTIVATGDMPPSPTGCIVHTDTFVWSQRNVDLQNDTTP
jgi:hypothetical protein